MLKTLSIWLVLQAALFGSVEAYEFYSAESAAIILKRKNYSPALISKTTQLLGSTYGFIAIDRQKDEITVITENNRNIRLSRIKTDGFLQEKISFLDQKRVDKFRIFKFADIQSSELLSNRVNRVALAQIASSFKTYAGVFPDEVLALVRTSSFENLSLAPQIVFLLAKRDTKALMGFVWGGRLYDRGGISIGRTEQLPVRYTKITDHFSSSRLHPILNYFRPHTGVDLAAPYGTTVYPIMDGFISENGYNPNIGNYVKVVHQGGLESVYGHLSKTVNLKPHTAVTTDNPIGLVGSSGLATGAHLHFGIKQNGKHINPILFLKERNKKVENSVFVYNRKIFEEIFWKLLKNGSD